jgi:hypothetical protein
MLPKPGDRVVFNQEFLKWHQREFKGLERWVGNQFIFTVVKAKNTIWGESILIDTDIFFPEDDRWLEVIEKLNNSK